MKSKTWLSYQFACFLIAVLAASFFVSNPFSSLQAAWSRWVGEFLRIGWEALLALAILALMVRFLDTLDFIFGSDKTSLSIPSFVGAIIGILIGLFWGAMGVMVFAFAGLVMGEIIYFQQGPRKEAMPQSKARRIAFGFARIAMTTLVLGATVYCAHCITCDKEETNVTSIKEAA